MPKPSKDRGSRAESSPFRKVAECLYRHESSERYYVLVKRACKQYRRSLKAKDRRLAERRLAEFREKIGCLSPMASAAKVTFADISVRWLDTLRPALKPSSFRRRETSLGQVKQYLGNLTLRQLSPRVCEEWAAKRGPEIAASTYNNERETIIAVLEYANCPSLCRFHLCSA